jgi:hypothetical protein
MYPRPAPATKPFEGDCLVAKGSNVNSLNLIQADFVRGSVIQLCAANRIMSGDLLSVFYGATVG